MIVTALTVAVLAGTSLLLLVFGLNLLYLTWRATRLVPRAGPRVEIGDEPRVCVQLPVYDERYVAERVIDAACALEWPQARLEIQVLDDSDDDTVQIVARRVSHWARRGVHVTQVRRGTRAGFKAGALAHGLAFTTAPYIAIFDADFVPPADFLRRTLSAFAEPRVGFVQARWGHLDEGYSWFTRLQALAIDFHFLVEQAVRSQAGYFTNFTGTAGVWRREAIEDSGGWSAATLTEDLDLSYRAQLRGWRAAYLEDLVVPEELPVSVDAYRRQQSRWATGSFQAAFRLLLPVLRSSNRAAVKFQAAMHLLAYSVGPLMLLQLACYPALLFAARAVTYPWQFAAAAVIVNLIGASPWVGFMVAQTRRGRTWWSGAPSLLCQVVGAGMSFTVMLALFRAARSGGEFVRTPKHQIVRPGQEWRDQAYVRVGDPRAAGEAVLGLGALALVPPSLMLGKGFVTLYASVFGLGFLTVAVMSAAQMLEVMTLRNLRRQALVRVRSAAPAAALLAGAGVLLAAAAQVGQPFEDGYGHWLIAANFAATGHLHDPLFGMEDTWLPGYHVFAAGVLRVFGLWNMDALRLAGVLCGVLTLGAVYRLAPNRRQARLAVALLALNPVFLFTASSTVVEPLLTALVAGAALAATRAHWKLAATLALIACATSTKAWIFAGAAAVLFIPSPTRWERMRVSTAPRAVFAVPVLGLLLLLPFASNSLARGAQEVSSAVARGSIAADPLARTAELVTTFGLAALPLIVLGAAGLWFARHRPDATLRLLHLPSLAYLTVVVVLVAAGYYTGSHRYLYPALPSLALLAAAALDRQVVVARAIAVAAAGLLAVAFLPVFSGFAAANSGLIAAGRAAAGSPGVLMTDSPVVAYFSGKPPPDITGSQPVPSGRDAAVSWLRARGVTVVVVEDIGYYRATAELPDLAAGRPLPPFATLGDERAYNGVAGKTVYAYRLGAALMQQSVYPGAALAIEPAPREGKTAPLAKGVTLIAGGTGAAGEGMGFGVPIVHYPDGWVYARTEKVFDESTPDTASWRVVYELDEIGGDAVHGYTFVPIASRGRIQVTYTVDPTGLAVDVEVLDLQQGYSEVAILNEQSAAFDDFADSTRTLIGPAFGNWVPVGGGWARLRSAALDVEWSVPAISRAQLYAGRELAPPGFDWAGLDYLFAGPFAGARYHVNVQQAR